MFHGLLIKCETVKKSGTFVFCIMIYPNPNPISDDFFKNYVTIWFVCLDCDQTGMVLQQEKHPYLYILSKNDNPFSFSVSCS